MIQFGGGVISNINLQLGASEYDLFTQNVLTYPAYTYTRRGGRTSVENVQKDINKIFQFKTSPQKNVFYTSGSSMYRLSGEIVGDDILDPDELHTFVEIENIAFFVGKNNNIYKYDGVNPPVIAKYVPRFYYSVNNAIDITTGSSIATINIANANSLFFVGQTVFLEGLTSVYGGNPLNGTFTISAVNTNSIEIDYGTDFNDTISDSGGTGILTALLPEQDYPKAQHIEVHRNRLYIISSEQRNRIYASNIITDTDDIFFINFTIPNDILNNSIFSQNNSAFFIDLTTDTGDYNFLHSVGTNLYIFSDVGVKMWEGQINSGVFKCKTTDSAVNRRAIDSDDGIMFFMGYKNLYAVSDGSIAVETIGTPNEQYIKGKENHRARVKCFDDLVLCNLGDIRNTKTKLEYITSLNGSSIDFSQIEGLTLVFNKQNETYTFFTDFNPNDYELVINENDLQLWMDFRKQIVRYDETNPLDLFDPINCRVVTHIKFLNKPADEGVSQISKFILLGNRLVSPSVKYKYINNDADVRWMQAQAVNQDNDAFRKEYTLEKKKARGVMVDVSVQNQSGYLNLYGYDFK